MVNRAVYAMLVITMAASSRYV